MGALFEGETFVDNFLCADTYLVYDAWYTSVFYSLRKKPRTSVCCAGLLPYGVGCVVLLFVPTEAEFFAGGEGVGTVGGFTLGVFNGFECGVGCGEHAFGAELHGDGCGR